MKMSKRRQLITTGWEILWEKRDTLYCLSRGCVAHLSFEKEEEISYKILPDAWNKPSKIDESYHYRSSLPEKFLLCYAEKLNQIHQVNWPLKSWRAVLSPWLTRALEVLYERYLSLINVDSSCEKYYVKVPVNFKEIDITPPDFSEACIQLTSCHVLNSIICAHIIESCCPNIEILKAPSFTLSIEKSSITKRRDWKYKIFKIIFPVSTFLKKKNKKWLFENTRFSVMTGLKILVKLKQLPYIQSMADKASCSNFLSELSVNSSLRKKLYRSKTEDLFLSLCYDVLLKIMPKAYLEGFFFLQEMGCKLYPKKINGLLTSTSHLSNEVFKIYAADQIAKDAKYCLMQHGGFYGTERVNIIEEEEIKSADVFYSWGWSGKKAIPMPALSLSEKNKRKKNAQCICILGMHERVYSYNVADIQAGAQYEKYLNFMSALLNNLPKRLEASLLFRTHGGLKSTSSNYLKKNGHVRIMISDVTENLYKLLEKTKLCLVSYNSTCMLQTFSMNIPTICFWDKSTYIHCDEAKPYFDLLEKVKILHYDPLLAAEHIDNVEKNISQWWGSEEVQEVKNIFCKKFALKQKKADKIWKNQLIKVVAA